MSKTLSLVFVCFFTGISQIIAQKSYTSESLKIEPISENIFIHVSYLQTQGFGKVACNGMVFKSGDEAIICDSPVSDSVSSELINWVEKNLGCTVKAVVATHFHVDCLGGLGAFHANNIPSYANKKTIQLSKSQNSPIPQNAISKELEIDLNDQKILLTFPGQGHTKDNVIAYIPGERAIFGGCLIKSVKASKGYLGDANLRQWSKTVTKIKAQYPDLEIVIPGHGKWGGVELLDYTAELFKNKRTSR